MIWAVWKITNWPLDVIRRQPIRDLKMLTESADVIDWNPPSAHDL